MNVDLNACISGSKPAWDAFVQQNSGIIYAAVQRALRYKTGDQRDVDDRVQDVFVRLIQNDCRLLRTYDARRASLSTWLTLVARSVVHQHLQKRSLNTVPLCPSDAVIEPDPISGSEPLPLDGLTGRQREVLEMLFEQGLSVEEAAVRIGVNPQTIRSTKHKALSRLRQELPDPRA